MYNFNMDNNALWANKPKLGNKPISSDFFNKDYGTVKYFSSIDAEIYFENLFIDDVVQISFSLQQNTLPLFGYNSYVYDELAIGSRIINGQFTINFTQAEYMYKVINELSKISGSHKEDNKTDLINSRKRGPILNKTFNIIVNYGKNSSSGFSTASGATQYYLIGVQLTSCTQQLNITGEPIYETYSFIAQDIITALPESDEKQISSNSGNSESDIEDNENYKLNIKLAEYSEENINGKIIGKIKIELDTDLDLKEVSINPKIDTQRSQTAKTIEVVDSNMIEYTISSELRDDIKQYYKNNSTTMPADFFCEYFENGELCMTEPIIIDIALKNIING